ncbi:hypothetical protein [Antrihabitans stalactiti]|uniref:Uncharacterized protein n=1 Tax=Antrihabitans stalactiti TaxID=2584121 RepID=A0A848K8P6_9NOCA|nr:hypothetical protein [Antrihabitans stalactiti]NMN94821.1 hypothetical protein [Antrihabitans stalactiti]
MTATPSQPGPPPDQAAIDAHEAKEVAAFDRIDALLQAVGPIATKVKGEKYEVLPGSALQLDHDTMPELLVASSVNRSLRHSEDCLRALHQLLQTGLQPFVPYLLVRGALETAATAVWLLKPDASIQRLERRAAIEEDDGKELGNALRSRGIAGAEDEIESRKRGFESILTTRELDAQRCKWHGYSAVIKDIDENWGTSKSVEAAWRTCSGMSHGKFWAFTAVTAATDTQSTGSGSATATFTPSYHPLAQVLGITVAILQRADRLYDERRVPATEERPSGATS